MNRPLLLRPTSAQRIGAKHRLYTPTIDLPGSEANPMLANGELLLVETDEPLPPALDDEVRPYQMVISLPDDLAKNLIEKGSINLIEESKPAAKPAKKQSKPASKEA